MLYWYFHLFTVWWHNAALLFPKSAYIGWTGEISLYRLNWWNQFISAELVKSAHIGWTGEISLYRLNWWNQFISAELVKSAYIGWTGEISLYRLNWWNQFISAELVKSVYIGWTGEISSYRLNWWNHLELVITTVDLLRWTHEVGCDWWRLAGQSIPSCNLYSFFWLAISKSFKSIFLCKSLLTFRENLKQKNILTKKKMYNL